MEKSQLPGISTSNSLSTFFQFSVHKCMYGKLYKGRNVTEIYMLSFHFTVLFCVSDFTSHYFSFLKKIKYVHKVKK
jgi:hypothetical protein